MMDLAFRRGRDARPGGLSPPRRALAAEARSVGQTGREERLGLVFEWDPQKATKNRGKHGVSFEEASTVFGDALSITIPDPEHSRGETRYLTVGHSSQGRLIVVSHRDHPGGRIRIISARRASGPEARAYQEG